MLRASRNERGSTLTLVMVICTVIGVVAVAVITFLSPVMRFEQNKHLKARLQERFNDLRSCIQDGPSWSYTVNDGGNPAAIRCLNAAAGCANGANAFIRLSLGPAQADGAHYCVPGYDSLNPAMGFSPTGEVCNTFSMDGNDLCPYRVEFRWEAMCPGAAATCTRPIEVVTAGILHKPGNAWTQALNLGDGMQRTVMPNARMSFAVVRGSGGDRVPIILAETRPAGDPAGNCTANPPAIPVNSVVRRNLDLVQWDLGMYSAIRGDGTFVLAAGSYSCEISVPGFLTGSHNAQLRNKSGGNRLLIWASSEYSPEALGYTQTRSYGQGTFTLTDPAVLAVEQLCSDTPVDGSMRTLTEGVPAANEIAPPVRTPEIYSIVSCVRTGGT